MVMVGKSVTISGGLGLHGICGFGPNLERKKGRRIDGKEIGVLMLKKLYGETAGPKIRD